MALKIGKNGTKSINEEIARLDGSIVEVQDDIDYTQSQLTEEVSRLEGLIDDIEVGVNPAWSDITDKPTFSEVATSGSFADLTEVPEIPEAGIPIGGTTNQVLRKSSNTNYDVQWDDATAGIEEAPNDGNIYGRQSNDWVILPQSIEYLSANKTVYVATTGDNTTGDGTSGLPWATIQFALNRLTTIHLNGFNYTVKIKAGTYSVNGISIFGVQPLGYGGNGRVIIESENANNVTDVVIERTSADVDNPSHFNIACPNYTVRYMTIKAHSTLASVGILWTNGATNSRQGFIKFIANGSANTLIATRMGGASVDVYASFGPALELIGNMEYSGSGFRNAFFCDTFSLINGYFSGGIVITFTSCTMFCFVELSAFSSLNFYLVTYSGTFTGKRYVVRNNSIANFMVSTTSIPGSIAGTTETQGQYNN